MTDRFGKGKAALPDSQREVELIKLSVRADDSIWITSDSRFGSTSIFPDSFERDLKTVLEQLLPNSYREKLDALFKDLDHDKD